MCVIINDHSYLFFQSCLVIAITNRYESAMDARIFEWSYLMLYMTLNSGLFIMKRSSHDNLLLKIHLNTTDRRQPNICHLLLYNRKSILYEVFSPKRFNLNLIKTPDLNSSLQEIQWLEEQVNTTRKQI